jgi:hypothetical protein
MNATHSSPAPQIRRLPMAPCGRFETAAHLALGLATLAAVWQFQAAILHFVPRAATFAERVRETPAALVDRSYALRPAVTNTPEQAAVQRATNAPARPSDTPIRASTAGSAI